MQVKVTVLIFWTKFAQKGYFGSKTEKSHFCLRPWSLLTILNFSKRGLTDTRAFWCLFSFYSQRQLRKPIQFFVAFNDALSKLLSYDVFSYIGSFWSCKCNNPAGWLNLDISLALLIWSSEVSLMSEMIIWDVKQNEKAENLVLKKL